MVPKARLVAAIRQFGWTVAEALKLVAPDPLVLVTGSLYFLGEAMERLGLATAHGDERTLNEWSPPKAPGKS